MTPMQNTRSMAYSEVFRQVAAGVDPLMEHPESFAYQRQAEDCFSRHMGG